MGTSDVFVSVVCAVQNAQDCLEDRLRRLTKELRDGFRFYEIILVDNASTDGTGDIVRRILHEEKNIQYCMLSNPKSESIALTAGLDRAIGDFIILMDPRIDPPELIPELLAKALSGSEIVYGLPRQRVRGGGLYDRLARLFLQLITRFNDVDIPQATSTYRLFSRSVLNYILESTDCHRILALAPALSGYQYASIEYERIPPSASDHRKVGRRALYRALDLTFATSMRPLRLIALMSVGISLLSVFYAIYVVFVRFFKEDVAPGWATLSLQVSGLFFLTSIVLAVMCEYLMQVLETTSRRPVYNIAREAQSSAMDYRQELNVVDPGDSAPASHGPKEPKA